LPTQTLSQLLRQAHQFPLTLSDRKFLNMSVNRHPNTQGVTIKQWRYTATGGETTLSGTDGFSQSLTYTPGAEEVFVNGVLLVRGTDYTASTGTTVVLNNALVAGDIATVSAPSVFNVANSIPSSTVTAKGDLLVANGSASLTNLAVGADGSTLVANSSAGGGVSWAGPSIAGGKNWLINGAMDFWARGTSFSGTGWAYTSDRWAFLSLSGNSTITQETSVVPSGFRYAAKLTANATVVGYLSQIVETANTLFLAGKTVTFSGLVAASTSIPLQLVVEYSTTVDAGTGASWTGISATSGGTATPTSTTYVPISGVFAIPSNAQTIRAYIRTVNSITSTQAFYFTGAQVEIGSVATAFSRAGGTLQGELSAAQRYYYKRNGTSLNGSYPPLAQGSAYSTTQAEVTIFFPVPMRVSPTAVESPTTVSYLALWDGVTLTPLNAAPTIPGGGSGIDGARLYAPVASGLTQYRPYTLLNNNVAGGYLAFSAEL
jgi:hypothetical protein